jgi:hypothetical protein
VITCIQSSCQHPRRQPSPCLCFHNLNPLCQIDGSSLNRLAMEYTAEGGKGFPAIRVGLVGSVPEGSDDDHAAGHKVVDSPLMAVQ